MSTQTKRILDSSWLEHVFYLLHGLQLVTKNTFSKRTPFLLLYSLFTTPKNYLLPAKRKVSYMSGKLSMSVLYWIFSNHLHSYCMLCKRRGMQQCHVFLNCCHVEKMTPKVVFGCTSGVYQYYHLARWKVTFAMYTGVTSAWPWVGVFASHSSHSSHFQLSRLEIRVS